MFISKHQHIGIIVKITALVDFFLEENEERTNRRRLTNDMLDLPRITRHDQTCF